MGIIQDRIEEQLVNIIESYHNQFGGNMEEDILGMSQRIKENNIEWLFIDLSIMNKYIIYL